MAAGRPHLEPPPPYLPLGPASEAPGGTRGAVLARWFDGLAHRGPLPPEELGDAVVRCLAELDEHEH